MALRARALLRLRVAAAVLLGACGSGELEKETREREFMEQLAYHFGTSDADLASRFGTARTVTLELEDAAPVDRAEALRHLLSDLEASMPGKERIESLDASLDEGLLVVGARMDRLYKVEFAVVFPKATLESPRMDLVRLVSRVVRWGPGGGTVTAGQARDHAHEALKSAIREAIDAGKPLHGRVELAPH